MKGEAAPLYFVHIAGRRVAYRRLGEGPAVLLLHGSPQSSLAVQGLGAAVAEAGLCAIMPDTPGAGFSAPLAGDQPGIADLAVALHAFADALQLGRCALYGSHTGAAIAWSFAAQFPARVSGLALDGLSAWTEAERAANAESYAPPFRPIWDGSHLAWLWARMEAQSLFFPWHRQDRAAWRGLDLSAPDHLHRNAMDMLRSGDEYRRLYRAALDFDPAAAPLPAGVPLRLMTTASDVLLDHASRPALAALPLSVFDTPPTLWANCAAQLAAWGGDPAPPRVAPGHDHGGLTLDRAAGPEGALYWRGCLSGVGSPLILLHEAGRSSRSFDALLAQLSGRRPVVAVDLPGHGLSAAEGPCPQDAQAVAALVAGASQALGLAQPACAGRRFGALVAQHLAARGTCHVTADLLPPPNDPYPHRALAERGAIKLTPTRDGTHLLRAWRVAQRMALWDPWYSNAATHARPAFEDLAPAALQEVTLDLLTAGPSWQTANALEAAAAGGPGGMG